MRKKVWKVEYFFTGDMTRSVVIADTAKEALDMVIDGEDVREDSIHAVTEIIEKGKVLTVHS